MKKYTLLLPTLVACVIFMASCSGFLDLQPKSAFTKNTFYKTDAEFRMALNGSYHRMQQIYDRYYYVFSEIRSDNSGTPLNYYRYADENVISGDDSKLIWEPCYAAVNAVNVLLDELSRYEMADADEQININSQARFIRALVYFDLVRFFGGVPITTKPVNEVEARKVPRSSADATYDFIIRELEEVKDLLSEVYVDNSVPTVVVVKALLAQVHIMRCGYPYYKDEWAKVRDYCKEVMDTPPFNNPDEIMNLKFSDLFGRSANSENSPEFIFSIKYKAGGILENNQYNKQFSGDRGSNHFTMESNFVGAFAAADLRLISTLAKDYYDLNTGELKVRSYYGNVIKFAWGYDKGNNEWGNDLPIIRYTDIRLMYAEALCEIAGNVVPEALTILNAVRARAGLGVVAPAPINIETWRSALLKERRLEFAFEGNRWFDLVRSTPKGAERLLYVKALNDVSKGLYFDEHSYIYPIPQKEVDLVNDKTILWQNPGYFGN